jgi:hypothetical protein
LLYSVYTIFPTFISNDELHAVVNCSRDDVNRVKHCLNNVEKGQKELGDGQKELGEIIDKLIGNGNRFDKLIEDSQR